MVALAVLISSACTTTSEPGEPATNASSANTNAKHEATEPPASRSCNTGVADAQAAIDLAAQAKRAANFPDEHEVDGPKALAAEGYRLSPMFPPQWPPTDCAVIFYVFEVAQYVANNVHNRRGPVAARVTVRLDTQATELARLDNVPGLGGELPYGGGGAFPDDRQQWVFDAVASSTIPKPPLDLVLYKEWLSAEEYVAAAVFVWHREFFDVVVGGDEDILREVEANTRTWTGDTGRHSPSRLPPREPG